MAARPDETHLVGGFAVPLVALDPPNPAPASGRYALFAFVGNEAATPVMVELP